MVKCLQRDFKEGQTRSWASALLTFTSCGKVHAERLQGRPDAVLGQRSVQRARRGWETHKRNEAQKQAAQERMAKELPALSAGSRGTSMTLQQALSVGSGEGGNDGGSSSASLLAASA